MSTIFNEGNLANNLAKNMNCDIKRYNSKIIGQVVLDNNAGMLLSCKIHGLFVTKCEDN